MVCQVQEILAHHLRVNGIHLFNDMYWCVQVDNEIQVGYYMETVSYVSFNFRWTL